MGEFVIDGEKTLIPNRLKFYYLEKVEFCKSYAVSLSGADVKKVFNKLVRHYKLEHVVLKQKRGKGYNCGSGRFYGYKYGERVIVVGVDTSMGTLCHELGHALEFQKFGKTKHGKRLMRIIRRINVFVEKKDFYGFGTGRVEKKII